MGGDKEAIQTAVRLIHGGNLAQLRSELGMSRTAMAAQMGVSPLSLKNWEVGNQGMKRLTAIRIVEWWESARQSIVAFEGSGGNLRDLMPISSYVSQLGISQQTIVDWCLDGEIKFEDLGVLGLFIYRSEVA